MTSFCAANRICDKMIWWFYKQKIQQLRAVGVRRYFGMDRLVLFDSIDCTENVIEAFATYYLNPVMEELYGHPAVYFIERNTLPGPNYAGLLFTTEEFMQGIKYNETVYGGILEVFKIGELTPGIVYSYYPNHYELLNLKDEVKKAYEYHGNKNYRFAEDYIGNFMLVYSLDEQRILGLR